MKILVVDDARDMRLVTLHLLKKLGHEVDTAEDGQDAWEKLQENDYHVVVSDWVMPRMDGLALCQAVREANFPHYIYFILLTGMSGKQNLISAIEAEADDFATKPVELEELDVRLRSARRVLELESSLASKNEDLKAANLVIKKDLANAAQTQLSVLPAPLKSKHLDIDWLFKPAIFVGGDTFNYFSISPDIFVFFCIDISGHGVSSAMISMSLQSSLIQTRGLYNGPITRERISEIPSIFAKNVNDMILNNTSDHYLTMVFGIIDFSTRDLYFVQAGHPYPFLYRKQTNQLEALEITGFPVGLFDTAEYETEHLKYEPGDQLIFYSDGINENKSAINNELLETENLHWHFDQLKEKPANEIIDAISTTWLTEKQMNNLPDDVSILIFKFNEIGESQ